MPSRDDDVAVQKHGGTQPRVATGKVVTGWRTLILNASASQVAFVFRVPVLPQAADQETARVHETGFR
jgi:hypothetical protein